MLVYTGDETGLIKAYSMEKNKLFSRFGTQNRENQIIDLKFLNDEEVNFSFQTLLLSSSPHRIAIQEVENGLYHSLQYEKEFTNTIVSAHIYKKDIIVNFENGENICLQSHKSSYKEKKLLNFLYDKIQKVVQNPFKPQQLLVLARDTNPKLYDIEENKFIWQARNVPSDFLDLNLPIFDKDACFVNKGKQVYVCTAQNRIRLYDINQGKRQPVIDQEITMEQSPFNNILISRDEKLLYVSNHHGSIFCLKADKSLKVSHKINVSKTTIKKMVMHPTQDYLATVGLDRHLRSFIYVRIFDYDTKELLQRQFLKQKLTCVLYSKQELNREVISDVLIDNLNLKRPMVKMDLNTQLVDRFKLKKKQKRYFFKFSLKCFKNPNQEQQETDLNTNFIDIEEYEQIKNNTNNIFEQDEISEANEQDQMEDTPEPEIQEPALKKKVKKEKKEVKQKKEKKVKGEGKKKKVK